MGLEGLLSKCEAFEETGLEKKNAICWAEHLIKQAEHPLREDLLTALQFLPLHNMNDCDTFKILSTQSDVENEKPMLQRVIDNAGHASGFCCKFHVELNTTEIFWCNIKQCGLSSVSSNCSSIELKYLDVSGSYIEHQAIKSQALNEMVQKNERIFLKGCKKPVCLITSDSCSRKMVEKAWSWHGFFFYKKKLSSFSVINFDRWMLLVGRLSIQAWPQPSLTHHIGILAQPIPSITIPDDTKSLFSISHQCITIFSVISKMSSDQANLHVPISWSWSIVDVENCAGMPVAVLVSQDCCYFHLLWAKFLERWLFNFSKKVLGITEELILIPGLNFLSSLVKKWAK